MGLPLAPGSPRVDPAPTRTPQDVANNQLRVQDQSPWGIFYRNVWAVLQYLLQRAVFLNGLAADIPDPTKYPENSRYWATDSTQEYVNVFATPGDSTTAAWIAM